LCELVKVETEERARVFKRDAHRSQRQVSRYASLPAEHAERLASSSSASSAAAAAAAAAAACGHRIREHLVSHRR